MNPQRKLNRQRKKKPQNKTVSLEMDNKKGEIIIYLAFFCCWLRDWQCEPGVVERGVDNVCSLLVPASCCPCDWFFSCHVGRDKDR